MRQRFWIGNRNVIGHNISRLRDEKGISQGELLLRVQLLGVDMTQSKLSRIEGRRIIVTDLDMIAIAHALGVTMDELCHIDPADNLDEHIVGDDDYLN